MPSSRRQIAKADRITVPLARSMLAQPFRLHCQKRHPMMKFWSKGEHEADHRMHDESLDHTHVEEVTEDVDAAGEPESDQSPDK